MRRLTAFDACFLPLSTDRAPLTIASVVILDGPAPETELLRMHLRERILGRPELRSRVVRAPADAFRPLWRDDPFDDPGAHLEHEPTGRSLEDAVAAVMERPLDLTRPPWRAHLVTGLADGRWAVVLAAHHVLADGAAGALLMSALLDGAAAPRSARPPLVRPRRPLRVALRTVVRPDLPPTSLVGPLSARRSWRWLELPADGLRAVARGEGCTVNDVFLAVLAGAYREYLAVHGEPEARIRALVPVSTRGPDDARSSGNIDAGLFVNLPLAEPDPHERLRSVARQTRASKAAGVPRGTEAMLRSLARVPYPALSRAARAYAEGRQRRVGGVAAHVRGPEGELSLLGRPVVRILPVMPLALEVRTSAALLTAAGGAAVGITADAEAVPDIDRLVAAVSGAWEQLADS